MARLDKPYRIKLGQKLRQRLPTHWRVVIGADGHAFIEVDQDGKRAENEFPTVGSTVIVIENNNANNTVQADVYRRVDSPPGYAEGREYKGTLAEVTGRGWVDTLANTVAHFTLELEAAIIHSGQDVAEA